ncbi:MAG: hypothetical protein AMXMBFR64_19430 [Myxococcales bacterium]
MVDIVMDAPGKNALGTGLMTWLLGQIRGAGDEPILLTGTGDAFSAGLNLREVSALEADGMHAFLDTLEELCVVLYTHPAPVVAAVNGHAIAGGAVIAACCDVRVCTTSPRARIGLNEVALGLRFPPAILRIVRARVAPRHLEEVLLGAALYDPEGAARVGLVDAVAADPVAVGRERLAALAALPRHAYAVTKADLRGDVSSTADEKRRFAEDVLPLWTSEELRARIRAILSR